MPCARLEDPAAVPGLIAALGRPGFHGADGRATGADGVGASGRDGGGAGVADGGSRAEAASAVCAGGRRFVVGPAPGAAATRDPDADVRQDAAMLLDEGR